MSKEMSKFDKIMKFDDESWFKKINFDLFDILEEYPMATGYADGDGVSKPRRNY